MSKDKYSSSVVSIKRRLRLGLIVVFDFRVVSSLGFFDEPVFKIVFRLTDDSLFCPFYICSGSSSFIKFWNSERTALKVCQSLNSFC